MRSFFAANAQRSAVRVRFAPTWIMSLTARQTRRKLLVWAQECVARSRIFHEEAADSWDFGFMDDELRFAMFMVRRKLHASRTRRLCAPVGAALRPCLFCELVA